ncbi:MAG: hypothetical protein HRS50_02160, partial [Mycoplasmataceae bacterium]|nr:hypothetical protein [Mycoplasmataceae bacterium]
SNDILVLSSSINGRKILKNSKNYVFRHNKNNIDNYKVERFISIKSNNNLNKELSKKTILK